MRGSYSLATTDLNLGNEKDGAETLACMQRCNMHVITSKPQMRGVTLWLQLTCSSVTKKDGVETLVCMQRCNMISHLNQR